MAVIKCSNCENEILDSEIVCPYCDCPVKLSREKNISTQDDDALSGATVKIATPKNLEKDNTAAASASPVEEKANADTGEASVRDDIDKTRKYTRTPETPGSSRSGNRGVSHGRKKNTHSRKKKDRKWVVLGITLVGIIVIIFLVINVFSRIFGEGLFDPERENKKAKEFVESSAEELNPGFEFNSHTLTITEESVVSEDYEANSEKPWKDHVSATTNLTIANGIEIIGTHAFDDISGLKHVTLATTVSSVGASAFYGCSKLEEVVVDSEKSKLRSIGDNAFTDCSSLKRIALGEQLKRIGAGAFKSCDSLEKIEIPDATTEIGEEAFLGCANLVIVCSADSYAYEYAMENGIAVEVLKDEEPDEAETEETESDQSSSTTSETAAPSSTKKDNTSSANSEKKPATTETPSANTQPDKETTETKAPQTPSQSDSSQSGTTSSTPQNNNAPSVEQQLSSLQSQLSDAQTQAEKDRILKEILKITQ